MHAAACLVPVAHLCVPRGKKRIFIGSPWRQSPEVRGGAVDDDGILRDKPASVKRVIEREFLNNGVPGRGIKWKHPRSVEVTAKGADAASGARIDHHMGPLIGDRMKS